LGALPRRFFCMAVLACVAAGCGGPGPANVDEVRTLAEGALRYRYLSPPNPHSTAMLLHDAGRDEAVWTGFAEQLAAQGFRVLAPSTPAWSADGLATLKLLEGLWAEAPEGTTVLIGEGAGAALALALAERRPGVAALVLLSPASAEGELDPLGKMTDFSGCPVLLMAGEADVHAAGLAMQLKAAAPAFCELQLYEGGAHGADLFAARPQSMTQVTDWLKLILGHPS